MKNFLILIGVLLLLAGAILIPNYMPSAETVNENQAIQLGNIHTLKSEILNEERKIWIYTPDNYQTSTVKFPVLYLTDVSGHYHHIIGTMRFLQRNGKIPAMIVVGIANTDRTRDLTPPITKKVTRLNGNDAPDFPTAGGADSFLEFFEKELFPYVDENFRTAPYKLFAGHSFGGLLAVHNFVNHNDLFQSYIAASPSLWWNDGSLIGQAETFLQSNKDLTSKIYLTMGNEGDRMLSNYEAFLQTLKDHAGENIGWDARHMPEESHGSVVLQSYYQGFESIFDGWEIPREIFTSGDLEGMIGHYAKLSEQMGYKIQAPESAINAIGYSNLGNKNIKKALAAFRYNIEQYPGAANVYDSYAEGLEADGQLEEAKVNFAKAVTLGEKNKDRNLSLYKENLARVTAKIAEKQKETDG